MCSHAFLIFTFQCKRLLYGQLLGKRPTVAWAGQRRRQCKRLLYRQLFSHAQGTDCGLGWAAPSTAKEEAGNDGPMILEALPPEAIASSAELPKPDLLVFTVPGLAVSMPTALGPGRYLPLFLSERQRKSALVSSSIY